MKVNRCRHLFSIDGQILAFIRKFYEGKKIILVVGYSYLHPSFNRFLEQIAGL